MNDRQDYLLIVDDVPDILELLEATLKFKGYRVVTARNGQEAMDAVQRERPVLIIADILMPRMDGFSLVHRLRLNPETRDVPVIFLSATYVAPEDKAFAQTIGVAHFIEKPVDLDQFLPLISEILEKKARTAIEPLNEFDFYDGYRKRLETKLHQKVVQIARDERLLETLSAEEKPSFKSALDQAISERDEIQELLRQIHKRLGNYTDQK